MKLRKYIILLLISNMFITFPFLSFSQGLPKEAQKQQKAIDEKKKAREKENQKIYKAALKKQQKIQTKETRKRMKEMNAKANRVNENKREFFLKRWFSKKQK
ncbi:MAG: hypothetical protein Q8880_08700 [Bacteroidota bacterium]|nr:hypothetical protein [Bacteroidota bacterium]